MLSGMADYQVLPPGLNSMKYKGVSIDPKDFQLSGKCVPSVTVSPWYQVLLYIRQNR